jgi:hypothetical protein
MVELGSAYKSAPEILRCLLEIRPKSRGQFVHGKTCIADQARISAVCGGTCKGNAWCCVSRGSGGPSCMSWLEIIYRFSR